MEQAANSEENLAYIFLRWMLYALLLTPLVVWSGFLFPFITTKVLYFRTVVELATFVYIILALRYQEMRPRWNRLSLAVWIYLAVIFFTSVVGLNFYRSFWGDIERGEGIVTILHFVLYFSILSLALRTQKQWNRFLFFVVLLTAVTAIYGLAQSSCQGVQESGSSFCNLLLPTQGTRISATIGNAAFFAAFVIFGIFFSLYLLRQETSFRKRLFLHGVFWFELFIVYETQTRGAMIALGTAFFVYFLVTIFKTGRPRVKMFYLVLLILLILSAGLIYVNRESSWVLASKFNRLATISSKDITTQSRLDTWNASWKGWKDRFLTGYGYENYNLAFNKYFPARIFKDQGSQVWFDRAHNTILDVGVRSGIVGLLSYLFIFVMAGSYLWQISRTLTFQVPWENSLILGVLLLAYFIQNLFVFDTQATYLMFFTLLAHISWLKNQEAAVSETAESAKKFHSSGFIFIAWIAVISLLVIYFVNIKPALANLQATAGIKAAKSHEYRAVQKVFERALSHHTYMDQEIRQHLVDYANEAVLSGQLSPEEQGAFYQYLIAELQKSIKEAPHDVKNYLYLMLVINRIGARNPNFLEEEFALGQEALKLSPTRPQIYFELGQAAFNKKDYEAGLKYFRQAIELNPEPKESHLNYLLGGILSGREDIVQSEKKIITDRGYQFAVNEYVAFAQAYLQTDNKQKTIENYQEAVKLSPKTLELHVKLATAYSEVCDLENARKEVQQITNLDLSFTSEGQQFLEKLAAKCKK